MGDKGIASTHCECPRGSFKCSHAAALAIFATHNIGPTDLECKWKKPTCGKEVNSAHKMYHRDKDYLPLPSGSVTEDKRQQLRDRWRGTGRCIPLGFAFFPEPEKHPSPISCLTVPEIVAQCGHLGPVAILPRMHLTEEQQKTILSMTVGQAANQDWHDQRKGRLTASNFGCVLKAKRITPSLLKRLRGEYNLNGVKAVQHGVANEQEGIKAFEKETGQKVEKCGLFVNRSGILGASPDGLVGTDSLLEVKCPYRERNLTLKEAVQNKDFCLQREGEKYSLKRDHVYWHQVQGQLYLSGRTTCHFIVWTTKDVAIIPINYDDSWKDKIQALETFYKVHILPSYVSI